MQSGRGCKLDFDHNFRSSSWRERHFFLDCISFGESTESFFNLFLKGTILQSESRRGVNSILITILHFFYLPDKIQLSGWRNLFRLIERIIFTKKLSKTDLPFRFCKIGPKTTFFYFWQKNGRLFVLLQLCPILTFFKLKHSIIELRKMLLRKKLFDVGGELHNP